MAVAHATGQPLAAPGDAAERWNSFFSPEVVQLLYQIALMGYRDLQIAPDLRSGVEMTLLRMLSFAPEGVATNVPGAPQPDKIEAPAAGADGGNENSQSSVDPVATGAAEGHQEALAPPEPAKVKDVELPELQPALPEASDDWYELVSALELAGVARVIVEHANLVEMRENGMVVRLDQAHDTLLNDNQVEVIRRAMSAQLKREISLEVVVGEVQEETPAARKARLREERLAAAELALTKDVTVHTLLTEFDGRLDDIQPVESSVSPAGRVNQEKGV